MAAGQLDTDLPPLFRNRLTDFSSGVLEPLNNSKWTKDTYFGRFFGKFCILGCCPC